MTVWIASLAVGVASLGWGVYTGVKSSNEADKQANKAEKAAESQRLQSVNTAKKQIRRASVEVGKKWLDMKEAKRAQTGVAKNCVDTSAVTAKKAGDTRNSRNGLV